MAIEEPRLKEIEALVAYRASPARVPAEILQGGVRVDKPVEPAFQVCGTCERPQGDYRSVAPTPIETDDIRHDAWEAYLAGWILHYPCRLVMRCQRQYLGLAEIREMVQAKALKENREPDHSDLRTASSTGKLYYLRIQFLYPDEKDARNGFSSVPGTFDRLGLWPPSHLPDDDTPRWIRANAMYHLSHELDEHLIYKHGVPFDPHHDSAYTCEACIDRDKLLTAVPELIAEIRELSAMKTRMEALATDLESHKSNVGMHVAADIRRRLRKP